MRGNLLYWSVCSDNNDVPCVFPLPARHWCFLLLYLPAPHGQVSSLWLVFAPPVITIIVLSRFDHHCLLGELQRTGPPRLSAVSLLKASLNKLKARHGCSDKMRCVRGVTGNTRLIYCNEPGASRWFTGRWCRAEDFLWPGVLLLHCAALGRLLGKMDFYF